MNKYYKMFEFFTSAKIQIKDLIPENEVITKLDNLDNEKKKYLLDLINQKEGDIKRLEGDIGRLSHSICDREKKATFERVIKKEKDYIEKLKNGEENLEILIQKKDLENLVKYCYIHLNIDKFDKINKAILNKKYDFFEITNIFVIFETLINDKFNEFMNKKLKSSFTSQEEKINAFNNKFQNKEEVINEFKKEFLTILENLSKKSNELNSEELDQNINKPNSKRKKTTGCCLSLKSAKRPINELTII